MLRHLATALIVLLASFPASAFDVTVCDQLVPVGQVGEVLNDLDCSGQNSAVRLDNRSTLHLNGHRLNGPTNSGSIILVAKSATITGPGELDTEPDGTAVSANIAVVVDGGPTGIDIHDCYDGIDAHIRARVSNVTVHDNLGGGLFGGHLDATNVTVSRVKFGAFSAFYAFRGRNVTATDNLFGFNSYGGASLFDSTIDGSTDYGGDARRVSLTNTTVSNSANVGVKSNSTFRMKNSSITGTGVGNGKLPPNIDLFSHRKPSLLASTCGKSWGNPLGSHLNSPTTTWGVCTND